MLHLIPFPSHSSSVLGTRPTILTQPHPAHTPNHRASTRLCAVRSCCGGRVAIVMWVETVANALRHELTRHSLLIHERPPALEPCPRRLINQQRRALAHWDHSKIQILSDVAHAIATSRRVRHARVVFVTRWRRFVFGRAQKRLDLG